MHLNPFDRRSLIRKSIAPSSSGVTLLKEIMEKHKFKQIRFIEWIKTNPQPLNSKINYLTNSREIALLGIKVSKPTFNSSYDNGIYQFPLQGGKKRFHPTQKSLLLFEELIKKHSKRTYFYCADNPFVKRDKQRWNLVKKTY